MPWEPHAYRIRRRRGTNAARRRVWQKRAGELLQDALIDVDGTLAETYGECKGGMDISYRGIWGYHPLIISLANTKEVLYLVNRPGNVASHAGAAEWIDKAIALVEPYTQRITLRGDSDSSLTAHFERWAARVDFLFGMDAHPALVRRAEALEVAAWEVLQSTPKYRLKTRNRKRPENVKQRIVKQRGYKNIRLASEHVAEFRHRPVDVHSSLSRRSRPLCAHSNPRFSDARRVESGRPY